MNVTRKVVADLWALCAAGEASEDSRRLVDDFFATDPEFARSVRDESASPLPVAPIELPPDHEAKTLDRIKRRLRRRSPFRILALAFTGLAVVRLVEQATFVRSPADAIGLAVAAVICWAAYIWHTRRLQEAGLPSRDRTSDLRH